MNARHHRRAGVATAVAVAVVVGGAASSVAGEAPTAAPRAVAMGTESSSRIAATDAPVRVHIGAPVTPVPVTVVTRGAADAAASRLVDRRQRTVAQAGSKGAEAGRPQVQKMTVGIVGGDLTHWGALTWDVSAWVASDGSCAYGTTSVPVDVRAHAMLGLATVRKGSTVALRGSLRAYHNIEGRYVAWSGRAVSVQRWTGTSWVQVTGARTDPQGDVALSLRVPSGTQLRLVAADTPSTWGAVSRTAVV